MQIILNQLLDRVTTQLNYEEHSEERIQERLESMSVLDLLHMLSYMDLSREV